MYDNLLKISFFWWFFEKEFDASIDVVVQDGHFSVGVAGVFGLGLKGLAFLLEFHERQHVLAEITALAQLGSRMFVSFLFCG